MRHLNYSHLLYFWTVAREGSIARASEVLHLTPQTISGQLKLLEESIGEPLFHRVGRGLVLSETGRVVNQYADEIFALGAELTQRVKRRELGVPLALNVGIVNSIPKLIAYRILEPALALDDPVRIICEESDLDALLGNLAVHRLDLVLSDRPVPAGLNVRAYNHPLGSSGVSLFAHRRVARTYERRFPESLDAAPVLLPVETTALRRGLDDWFERQGVAPRVIAEFDDSALMKAFGGAASGIFPSPDAIEEEVQHMYHARKIGPVDGVSESFYAISPERKIKHPAVLKITEAARDNFLH
jgi:LysR family transcriptional activator of nhaA